MAGLSMYTVDAFTTRCFSGNPAAVCPDVTKEGLSDELMQHLAAEMNLSETAFVRTVRPEDTMVTGSRFSLRWFTPLTEIKMCGHATLASAFVLFEILGNQSQTIIFETLSGELKVSRDGHNIQMDFPTSITTPEDISDHQELLKVIFGGSDSVAEIEYCSSIRYLLVRLKDGSWTREQFEKWAPPIGSMSSADQTGKVILVLVTLRGEGSSGFQDKNGEEYDFVSRSFAPWTGVPEDPVTGSAHTVLSYYWSQRLGKQNFYARQCSKRGGDVRVRREGDRTFLIGQAVLVSSSTLSNNVF